MSIGINHDVLSDECILRTTFGCSRQNVVTVLSNDVLYYWSDFIFAFNLIFV